MPSIDWSKAVIRSPTGPAPRMDPADPRNVEGREGHSGLGFGLLRRSSSEVLGSPSAFASLRGRASRAAESSPAASSISSSDFAAALPFSRMRRRAGEHRGLLVGEAPADLDLGQRFLRPSEELFVLHPTSLPRSLRTGGEAGRRWFGPSAAWVQRLGAAPFRAFGAVASVKSPGEILRRSLGSTETRPYRRAGSEGVRSHEGGARAVPRRVEHHAPRAWPSELGGDEVGPAFGAIDRRGGSRRTGAVRALTCRTIGTYDVQALPPVVLTSVSSPRSSRISSTRSATPPRRRTRRRAGRCRRRAGRAVRACPGAPAPGGTRAPPGSRAT